MADSVGSAQVNLSRLVNLLLESTPAGGGSQATTSTDSVESTLSVNTSKGNLLDRRS